MKSIPVLFIFLVCTLHTTSLKLSKFPMVSKSGPIFVSKSFTTFPERSWNSIKSSEFISGIRTKYGKLMSNKPLRTKALSSSVGFIISEIISQLIFKAKSIDFIKLILMASFGGLVHGPMGHVFYGKLNQIVSDTSPKGLMKKIAVDQLIYVPILNSILVLYFGILLGYSPKRILAFGKKFIPHAILFSWALWPISHAANYNLIPARSRLSFINFIQIVSNIGTSKLISSSA